jgi:imidazole glycerol phosphate synthase subunit HisF
VIKVPGATGLIDTNFEGKADAALAASIFHYGLCSISELKKLLAARGLRVRV